MAIQDRKHFDKVYTTIQSDHEIVPLFLKSPDGELHIIPAFFREGRELTEGHRLVYLGNLLETDTERDEVVSLPKATG